MTDDLRRTWRSGSPAAAAAVATFLVSAALLLSPGAARAQQRLAVLEFTGKKVEREVLQAMADEARSAAARTLRGRYEVMTRQNMAMMIKAMGGGAKCEEGECEVETGRNIGATLIVTGDVTRVEGVYLVLLKVFETEKGVLLAGDKVKGKNQTEVIDKIGAAMGSLLSEGLRLSAAPVGAALAAPVPEVLSAGPSIKRTAVTEPVGDLTITAKPKELVRLEVTDPSGKTVASGSPYKNASAAVGRWKVVAKATGYEEHVQEITVAPDEGTSVNLELKQLGGLQVIGTPEGAAVKVSGPGGFVDEGGLPWEASGLRSGAYRVEVTRKGYEIFEQQVTVAPGQSAVVRVDLKKEAALADLGRGSGGCPAGMSALPGGTFTMGHLGGKVSVQPFCLDVTEVTVEAYSACVERGKCSAAGSDNLCNGDRADRRNHPINCVDWNQAVAFCEAQAKRLPSEEEWEWAARGGPRGSEYPWGNELPRGQLCWDGKGSDLGEGNRQHTCAVGSYLAGASPQGILDLAGNVREWTAGIHNASSSSLRAFRGGSWSAADPGSVRAAFRFWFSPSDRNSSLGFRCARTR